LELNLRQKLLELRSNCSDGFSVNSRSGNIVSQQRDVHLESTARVSWLVVVVHVNYSQTFN